MELADTLIVLSSLSGFTADYWGNDDHKSSIGQEPPGVKGRQAIKSKEERLDGSVGYVSDS